MAPEEFGLFGIGFALVMVLNGFWQGFFIVQYLVLAPTEDSLRFPAQVYTAMVLVSVVTGALMILVAAVLQGLFGIGLFALGIGGSAIAFSLKEFHIRYAFSIGKGSQAVWVNGLMAVSLVLFLGVAQLADLELSANIIFALYALVVAIAALFGHFLSELALAGHRRSDLYTTIRKLAKGGKWAIATNVIFSLRNNAHVIVLAMIMGPTGVARLNAARLFVTPPLLLLPALSNVVLPYFARTYHEGGLVALRAMQKYAGAAFLAMLLGYTALLLFAWSYLETILVEDQYQGLAPLVAAWCAFAAILALRSIIDWGAQVERRFALITKISVGVTFLALTAAVALTLALGPMGAVLAIILAEFVMAAVLWMTLSRRI